MLKADLTKIATLQREFGRFKRSDGSKRISTTHSVKDEPLVKFLQLPPGDVYLPGIIYARAKNYAAFIPAGAIAQVFERGAAAPVKAALRKLAHDFV